MTNRDDSRNYENYIPSPDSAARSGVTLRGQIHVGTGEVGSRSGGAGDSRCGDRRRGALREQVFGFFETSARGNTQSMHGGWFTEDEYEEYSHKEFRAHLDAARESGGVAESTFVWRLMQLVNGHINKSRTAEDILRCMPSIDRDDFVIGLVAKLTQDDYRPLMGMPRGDGAMGYLHNVVRNEAVNMLRYLKAEKRGGKTSTTTLTDLTRKDGTAPEIPEPAALGEDELSEEQMQEAMEKWLATLNSEEAQLYECLDAGMKSTEIASELGWSKELVYCRKSRLKNNLKLFLNHWKNR